MLFVALLLAATDPRPPPPAPAAALDAGLVLPALNVAATVAALGLTGIAGGFGAGRTAAGFASSLAGLGAGALLNVALFSPAAVVDVNRHLAPGVMLLPLALLAPLALGGAESLGGHGFGPAGALGLSALAAAGGVAIGLVENLFVDLDGAIPVALSAALLAGALGTCAYAVAK